MKMTRRILSWVLAIALVVTCGITGLVLPVTAEEAPADLINGQGTFEDDTTPASTILSDMMATADSIIVDNPSGEGKVLQLGAEGTFKHGSYPKLKKLYNAETGAYDKYMTAGKCYTLTLDVYGDGIGLYFQSEYTVLSHNADELVGGKNGWYQLGPDAGLTEWKTYTIVFYPGDNIKENYHSDWWSWGVNFSKGGNQYCPTTGYTYIDNVKLVETPATAIELDGGNIVLEPGDEVDAPAVNTVPARSTAAATVWSTDAEGVAKVDAATGKVTAVANGTATITATAGELTASYKVTVQKDKTQEWADLSNAYYTAGANKNQKVDLKMDAATGLEYFSVLDGNSVATPKFSKIDRGEWIG